MKKLLIFIALVMLNTPSGFAKIGVEKALTYNSFNPIYGKVNVRTVYIWDSNPNGSVVLLLERNITENGDEVYTMKFQSFATFSSPPNKLLFKIDGSQEIFESIKYDWGYAPSANNSIKIFHTMNFIVDRMFFERIANAQEIFEFAPMIDEESFNATTIQKEDVDNLSIQMKLVISDALLDNIL